MTPQFRYDKKGNVTGVFLSIEEWNELIKEYPGVNYQEESSQSNIVIPNRQIELGKKEIRNIVSSSTELVEWEEVKKQKPDAVELLEEAPIPEWQKKEVRKRLKDIQKNPSKAVSWDEATEKIKHLAK